MLEWTARPWILLGAAILCAGLAADLHGEDGPSASAAARGVDIYFVDTEGGAATLIVTPLGESILVDTGNPGDRDAGRIAKAAIELAGLAAIDHVITTHWHLDHVGGVASLADRIPLRSFLDNGIPEPLSRDIRMADIEAYRKAAGGKTRVLAPGDELVLKGVEGGPQLKLRVVAAGGKVIGEGAGAEPVLRCDHGHEAADVDTSDNARSIGFVLSYGAFDFFDGGDLTWNVEHRLVCPKNIPGKVDVFQVNHHGLDLSNNPALVDALAPRVAVINNGPRKGGEQRTFRTLKACKSVEAIFQLHRNVRTGAGENAEPAHVANDDETCQGELVKLSVAADGASYTVSVPSKKTVETFASTR